MGNLKDLIKLELQNIHTNKIIRANSEKELMELCFHYGLSKTNIINLINGTRKTHYDYKLVSVKFATDVTNEQKYKDIVLAVERLVNQNLYQNQVLNSILEELDLLVKTD